MPKMVCCTTSGSKNLCASSIAITSFCGSAPPLPSALDTGSEAFRRNRDDVLEQLAEIDTLLGEAEAGGGPERTARLRSRGKLPIRERIANVLDPDTPFLEISPLAAYRSDYTMGGGMVVGIGVIAGTECVIMGNDPTVLAAFWDVYHSGAQTFGFARLYDQRAGNPPAEGRVLDFVPRGPRGSCPGGLVACSLDRERRENERRRNSCAQSLSLAASRFARRAPHSRGLIEGVSP